MTSSNFGLKIAKKSKLFYNTYDKTEYSISLLRLVFSNQKVRYFIRNSNSRVLFISIVGHHTRIELKKTESRQKYGYKHIFVFNMYLKEFKDKLANTRQGTLLSRVISMYLWSLCLKKCYSNLINILTLPQDYPFEGDWASEPNVRTLMKRHAFVCIQGHSVLHSLLQKFLKPRWTRSKNLIKVNNQKASDSQTR